MRKFSTPNPELSSKATPDLKVIPRLDTLVKECNKLVARPGLNQNLKSRVDTLQYAVTHARDRATYLEPAMIKDFERELRSISKEIEK